MRLKGEVIVGWSQTIDRQVRRPQAEFGAVQG
ncbi:hypothetical protein N826_06245 [Skermanella aerolata KACC 11604]|nr:hypothetical protein N826_06245 [Skermanella aerolata KACC 11604]